MKMTKGEFHRNILDELIAGLGEHDRAEFSEVHAFLTEPDPNASDIPIHSHRMSWMLRVFVELIVMDPGFSVHMSALIMALRSKLSGYPTGMEIEKAFRELQVDPNKIN